MREEFNIKIKKAIKDFILRRGAIFSFLWGKNQIKDLGNEISLWSNERNWELEPGIIDSKPKEKTLYSSITKEFTVIEMVLEINKELVKKWDSNGKRTEKFLEYLDFYGDLKRFADSIEKCILKEIYNFSHSIHLLEKVVFRSAVVKLSHRLKAKFNTKFTLISDFETFSWAENEKYENGKTVKEQIENRDEIEEWSDFSFKGENLEGENHQIVCIPNDRRLLRIIEESPVNIEIKNDQIHLYWLGAIEVDKRILEK